MKHLILAMCLGAAGAADPKPTVEGTWRADADNYWTRSRRALDLLQLQHDGSNTGIGIPERDAAGARRTAPPTARSTSRSGATPARSTSPAASTDGRGARRLHASRPTPISSRAWRRLGYPSLSTTTTSWRSAIARRHRARFAQDVKAAGARPSRHRRAREDADPRRHARVHQGDARPRLQGSPVDRLVSSASTA